MPDIEKESARIEATEKKQDSEAPKEKTASRLDPELLEELPPEVKKQVVEFGMSMQRFGPVPNPISEKINEKHIQKILEIAEKDDERSFKDLKESRKYTLLYILVFAVLFIFTTVFLVGSDKDLYKEIIKLFSVFMGGLGGGFGIKSYMDRNK